MVTASFFWQVLLKHGFSFSSGVPCSLLTEILNNIPENVDYIPATREDNALGVTSGAYLAGRKSLILIQNSGLGNIVNGLTSFNLIYKIPVLMIISWRGEPGKPDAPEHSVMGPKTLPLLQELGLPYKILSEEVKNEVNWASETMEKKKIPVALILRKGLIG